MKVMFFFVLVLTGFMPCIASAHPAEGGKYHDEAIGEPGRSDQASRVIDIRMDDNMRFTPSRIVVRQGETIRFTIENRGKLKHEMVIGSLAALKAHATHMMKFPEMKHSEPNQLSLEPGQEGEILWHFTSAGNFYFGCLQPAHLNAGMIGSIAVK